MPDDENSVTLQVPTSITPMRNELQHCPKTRLKNLQWQKLDFQKLPDTIWGTDDIWQDELEVKLNNKGVFDTIETMFPAKINTFFEKRSIKKPEETKTIKFLTRDKSKNISKFLPIITNHVVDLFL
jgi:hypothetical protein